MIIDFHTHTFPEALAGKVMEKLSDTAQIQYYTDGTNNGLLSSMTKAGVDLSIVLPVVTKPSQHTTINDSAKKINETYAEQIESLLSSGKNADSSPVLMSFGGIHPDNEDYRDILKNLKASGIKGIKIHPVYQETDIDDIRFLRIIDFACELGLIIVTHSGRDLSFEGECCAPDQIRRMIDAIHPRNMILAHMGGVNHWDEVGELLCDTDVYLDTSFSVIPLRAKRTGAITPQLDRDGFRNLVKKKGADHIVFATDCPWGDQTETYSLVNSYLDNSDKTAVFSGNALRLLRGAD